MSIQFKKLHPEAQAPVRAHPEDAGADLVAVSKTETALFVEYGTGISVSIPIGWTGLLFARSSVTNKALMLGNAVGVIDSGYQGEIKLRFKRLYHIGGDDIDVPYILPDYKIGDKVGQLVLVPCMLDTFEEVTDLNPTVRGDGGFGSSGI